MYKQKIRQIHYVSCECNLRSHKEGISHNAFFNAYT